MLADLQVSVKVGADLRKPLRTGTAGYPRGLYGGVEYEFYHPVRAGDVLTATDQVKNIYEREGKTGKMVFLVIETTYVNQDGQLVAKARETAIRR